MQVEGPILSLKAVGCSYDEPGLSLRERGEAVEALDIGNADEMRTRVGAVHGQGNMTLMLLRGVDVSLAYGITSKPSGIFTSVWVVSEEWGMWWEDASRRRRVGQLGTLACLLEGSSDFCQSHASIEEYEAF